MKFPLYACGRQAWAVSHDERAGLVPDRVKVKMPRLTRVEIANVRKQNKRKVAERSDREMIGSRKDEIAAVRGLKKKESPAISAKGQDAQ